MRKISKPMMIAITLTFCSLCAYAFLQYAHAVEKTALHASDPLPADHLEAEALDDLSIPDIQLIKSAIDVAKGFWPVS